MSKREIDRLVDTLERLALEFQREVKTPLGFHAPYVEAKRLLRAYGRELPNREEKEGF